MLCATVRLVIIVTIVMVFGWTGMSHGADQKVMLMLGGKFCDAYLGDVRDALTKMAGVKDVDLKSMKGHAVVTVEGGTAKPEQLAAAINRVKGDGWYCTGQVMK